MVLRLFGFFFRNTFKLELPSNKISRLMNTVFSRAPDQNHKGNIFGFRKSRGDYILGLADSIHTADYKIVEFDLEKENIRFLFGLAPNSSVFPQISIH